MPESPQAKPNAFFTRYEIVAVAIPGGVFLFGLVAGGPLAKYVEIDYLKVNLGALGLFTVAAFCTGQVIQALSASLETLLQYPEMDRVWRLIPKYNTTPRLVPRFLEDRFAALLSRLGADPNSLSRSEYRHDVFPFILARLYRSGVTDRLLDLRVSWGLHRALALTFLALAILLRPGWITAILVSGTVIMVLMANRYRRQYYDQGTFEFIDLEGKPS